MAKTSYKTFAELQKRRPEERLKRERVDVPEWGASFFVRQLSGKEFEIIRQMQIQQGPEDFSVGDMAKILAMGLEDKSGQHPPEDWLIEEPFVVLRRLTEKVFSLNGMSEQQVTETEKNS